MSETVNIARTRCLVFFTLTAFLFSCGSGNNSDLCKEKSTSDPASAPAVKNYYVKSDIPYPKVDIEVADPENDLCSATFRFYYPDDEETPTETSSLGGLGKDYDNDTDRFKLSFTFVMEFWERWRMDIILIDQEGNSSIIQDIYLTKKNVVEIEDTGTITLLTQTETEYTFQPPNETQTLGTQYATSGTQGTYGTFIIMAH